jgi:hypothetical protein
MSSESVSRAFCLESIRYAYQILGYDTLIKEIEFIHHLHNKYHTDFKNTPNTSDTHSLIQSEHTENNLSVSHPNSEQELKSDLNSSHNLSKNTDIQKEVIVKSKRGRKPLSSKKTENTDNTDNIKPVVIHDLSNHTDNTCSSILSNGMKCSVKRYTDTNPQSIHCFQHFNLQ